MGAVAVVGDGSMKHQMPPSKVELQDTKRTVVDRLMRLIRDSFYANDVLHLGFPHSMHTTLRRLLVTLVPGCFPPEVHMHVTRSAQEDLPTDDEGLQQVSGALPFSHEITVSVVQADICYKHVA